MNNFSVTGNVVRISKNISVTNSNSIYEFAYAGLWDSYYHSCCEKAKFSIRVFDCGNISLSCLELDLSPGCAFQNKGETLKTGVYVYLLDYKGPNGKNNKRTGHVNLSR